MKKINIIKSNDEYNRIIKNIKPYKFMDYIIYLEKVNTGNYYFGFSIGKKIGNAVTRNKIKRQIKNIIDEKNYQNNFNCIIMVGKGILNKTFQERRTNLLEAINKLDIIKGEQNEKQ